MSLIVLIALCFLINFFCNPKTAPKKSINFKNIYIYCPQGAHNLFVSTQTEVCLRS